MPKHNHDRSGTLSTKLQATSHQCRSNSLVLKGGRYGHRRKGDGGNGPFPVDLDTAEQNVADDALIDDGHQGYDHGSAGPLPIHEFSLRIAVECQPIHFPNGMAVGGEFFTDERCWHSVIVAMTDRTTSSSNPTLNRE